MDSLNILKFLQTPKKITREELSSVSLDIYNYLYDDKISYDLFVIWDNFFQKVNFDKKVLSDLDDSFFNWYTIVFFKNVYKLKPLHFAKIFPYLFMKGFYLNKDVLYIYVDYLMINIIEDSEQNNIHSIISEKVLNLDIPFDYQNGLSFKELFNYRLQDFSNNDIEKSKIIANIEKYFSKSGFFESKSVEDKIKYVNNFLNFLDFLSDKKSIQKIRKFYFDSSEYLPTEPSVDITDWLADAYFNVYGNPVLEEIEKKIVNQQKSDDYIEIKNILEQQFAYDENGELSPIEEVLSILSQMAEEQGDANIEELYMFDENVGKFVWNEELINTK